ncbi:MAG: ABC transporter ATP-binding protein [Micrococcaceae bacterium]|nr:ABC transporter ATP-binding protein [Micrococcaceae bacterium]
MINIQHLTKRFGHITALDDVSLQLEGNRIVGLLGENGCGKTTLMNILTGMNQPSDGSVEIAGHAPGEYTKSIVSYLPDTSNLPPRAHVKYLIQYFDDFFTDFKPETCRNLLKQFGLSVDARLNEMSKGQREKVHVALTMSREASVYLLDEPISGVDPAARDHTLKAILSAVRPDAVMIIATHLVADIEFILDDAIFMRHGKVLRTGAVEGLRAESHQSLNEYFKEVYAS